MFAKIATRCCSRRETVSSFTESQSWCVWAYLFCVYAAAFYCSYLEYRDSNAFATLINSADRTFPWPIYSSSSKIQPRSGPRIAYLSITHAYMAKRKTPSGAVQELTARASGKPQAHQSFTIATQRHSARRHTFPARFHSAAARRRFGVRLSGGNDAVDEDVEMQTLPNRAAYIWRC